MDYKIIDIDEINTGLINGYCGYLDGYDFKTGILEQFDAREWREVLKYLNKLDIKTMKQLIIYCAQLNGDIPAIQAGE